MQAGPESPSIPFEEAMRIASLTLIGFGLTTCVTVPGTSQICAGSSSFARSPYVVSGGGGVSRHSHGFGAGLTLGGPSKFFGVGIGRTHFDVLNGSSFDVSAGAGLEFLLDHRGALQLCPIVSVGHSAGPDHTQYGDYSETDVAAGLRLGDVAMRSKKVRLIPTVGFGLEHTTQSFSSGGPPLITAAHTFGVLTLGGGVVFGNTTTVSARASVPIGLHNGSAAFSLGLAVNLGG
jgi:hypothetical protein